MTIRDLLVHVDHTPASDGRLAAALALAAGLGAHVTALYLIAEPFMRAMPSGMAGLHLPDGLIRQHLAGVEQEANAILAAAQEAAARLNVALDPCRQTGRLDRLPTLLACHARHADLTVVGQPDLEVGGVDDTLLVEAAFMDTGRPALVVPSSWIGALPPRRAIIAWDGSREATRAVHDAMPLLRLAERTIILIVDARALGGHLGGHPGEDIRVHLTRHEIYSGVKQVESARMSIGDVILAQAKAEAADLIVMGGYGHSRLREMLVGGTTRYMLEHMTTPILFAH